MTGWSVTSVEPLLPEEASRHRAALDDLVVELSAAAAGLRESLPQGLRAPLADAVRAMNCYYSNLIEGHDTHPHDIERALAADFSREPEQRDLQLEALAHIQVQKWVDSGGLRAHPMARESLCEIHARFCENLPESLLVLEDGTRIEGGALRTGHVRVGRHVAPEAEAVPRLLEHMQQRYAMLGRAGGILGLACAHHRLMWVHPFADLNGRVGRMVSHAWLRTAVGSAGLWSVSRGLARNEAEYKRRLMAADEPRHGGADGRGALSEQRLAEFARFFLETCLDQVRFMEGLMRPDQLRGRIEAWATQETAQGRLPAGAWPVLREALYTGEVARAALPGLLGVGERQARNVSAALVGAGALNAQSSRAPLRLTFSARLAGVWMPGLFP